MKTFGSPETWNQKVDDFLEKEKPQASLIEDLAPGPLRDEYLKDYDPKQETYEEYLRRKSIPIEDRPFNMSEGGRMKYGVGTTVGKAALEYVPMGVNKLKQLLSNIKPYEGATEIGVSTKKLDRGPEEIFTDAFRKFKDNEWQGNFSAAARALGESREKIKAIFDRLRVSKTGSVSGSTEGRKVRDYIPGEDFRSFGEITTDINYDKDFLSNLTKDIKPGMYTIDEIGQMLKLGKPGGTAVQNKKELDQLSNLFKQTNVKNELISTGPSAIKKYDIDDVVTKFTDRFYDKKRIAGVKKAAGQRKAAEEALDPDLYGNFLSDIQAKVRAVSKDEDIFFKGAVEDIGHPISIAITNKYPKLFKNSGINKINSLVFQDPTVNREILLQKGYEGAHDKLFKQLNDLVGKKNLSYNDVKKIKQIKTEMNALHDKAVSDTRDLIEKVPYLKGQEKNIPRIDIKIPNVGETFKSENMFVNMNKVNPAAKVGYIDKIAPDAKKLSDLTTEQKLQYKANIADQYADSVSKFYKKLGYDKEQIAELRDAVQFGTESRVPAVPQGFDKGGSAKKGYESPFKKSTGFGKYLKPLIPILSPTVIAADYAIDAAKGDLDLSKPEDRLLLEVEAAFAPDLVKGVFAATKGMENRARQQAIRKFLNLGMKFPTALKYARIASPLGLASLGAEGIYYLYKKNKELEQLKETDPEKYAEMTKGRISDPMSEAEYDEIQDMGREGAMGGGIMRLGLKNGPDDPSKRKFIKGAIGIASLLPFGIGKIAKKEPVQKAVTAVAEAAPQGWSWVKDNFWTVYNKVLNKGQLEEVTKKGINVTDHKGIKVIEDQNQIRVRYQTDKGNTAETVYNKPTYEVDPETGKAIKVPGEFEEYQDVYRMSSDGNDYYKDFEEEIVDSLDQVKDVFKKD
jgi:hypothetical protein